MEVVWFNEVREEARMNRSRLTMSLVVRPNWFWRLTTVSETLKKSIESQAQANHLERSEIEVQLVLAFAKHSILPREKETPLGEGETPQDLEERSRVLCFLSTWYKVSDEVRCH
jgi:hypothetical protein